MEILLQVLEVGWCHKGSFHVGGVRSRHGGSPPCMDLKEHYLGKNMKVIGQLILFCNLRREREGRRNSVLLKNKQKKHTQDLVLKIQS